jgi:hypothetical protein
MTPKPVGASILAVVLAVAGIWLVSCGGSSTNRASGGAAGDPNEIVARVGATAITRAAVSHWMSALAGGEYYELSRNHTIPAELAFDPPRYGRCVASLEGAEGSSPAGSPKPSSVHLLSKCQQIYQALKTQATAFLVATAWTIASDRELGITASDQEVLNLFKRVRASAYPSDAQLHEYLAARRLTLSDLLLQTRLNLLAQKALQKIGPAGAGKAVKARFDAAWTRWAQKTDCRPGYVVEHCRQYKGGPTYPHSPPASVMMEEVAGIATGRCASRAVCADK